MRFDFIILVMTLVLAGLVATSARADDWEALLASMSQDDPALAAKWEKAKKDAEKNEKNLKNFADKQFQSSFDTVFGKDIFKPSEGLDLLKVIEAVSAGDIETAGTVGSEFLIAKYTPGLGQYIMVMKAAATGIKTMEQVWINGLKQTKAYENFISAVFADSNYDRPYIPSYVITYMRSNKAFGTQISKVYDEMRAREDRMFNTWMNDDVAVTQMGFPSWSSRWISARGKVPSDREMFNYFLYDLVKNSKAQYLEKFGEYYLEPMVRQEARQQRQRLNKAMQQALTAIAVKANSADKVAAQCKSWYNEYMAFAATKKQTEQAFRVYVDGVYRVYTKTFNAMLVTEKSASEQRLAPWRKEQAQLEQENEELDALEDDVDSARAELSSLRTTVQSLEASLPSDQKDPSYNAGIDAVNAAVRSYNSARLSSYLPAKSAYERAAAGFNSKNDAFNARYEAFWNESRRGPASQKLVGNFNRIRQSIQLYQKGETSCTTFAKYSVEDGMSGLIGVDPASGIAICNRWMASIKSANVVAKKRREKCE
jgi:hypothetical protein